ncbi:MAG: hypothetical protein QXL52_04750 [Nitrososphaerales archaeon]
MSKSKGYRHKTRSLLTKKENKGLTSFLHDYKVEDKVIIDINPSQVKGMPHRRYQGLIGTVEEVRKRSLVIRVPIGNKVKKIIARLEHIKPFL